MTDIYDDLAADGDTFFELPLWALELDKKSGEDSIADWFKSMHKHVTTRDVEALNLAEENHSVFKTGSSAPMTSVAANNNVVSISDGDSHIRLDINHLYDIIELNVSNFSGRPTVFEAIPTSSTEHSKTAKAHNAKQLLDTLFYDNKFDVKHKPRAIRNALTYGEGYVLVHWDDRKGEPHPDSDLTHSIPIVDETGLAKDSSGKIRELRRDIRTGDVAYKHYFMSQVFFETADSVDDSDWVLLVDTVDVNKLRLRHADKAKDIKVTSDELLLEKLAMSSKGMRNKVVVYTLYHRATDGLPNGKMILATPETVLFKGDMPFEKLNKKRKLPIARLTDADVEGELRGRAITIMENGKDIQTQMGNLLTDILHKIASLPPVLDVPLGSELDDDELRSGELIIVRSDGNTGGPKYLTADGDLQSKLALYQTLQRELHMVVGLQGITRGGAAPSNTRIESGDQFDTVRNQQTQRAATMFNKIDQFLVDIAEITLDIATDMYEDDEERVVKVFGEHNQYTIDKLNLSDIDVPVDITVQRAVGIPDSWGDKINFIKFMTELGLPLDRKEIANLLNVPQPQKYLDSVDMATNDARKENEDMMNGKTIPSPQPYEDLLAHYAAHLQHLQNPSIRATMPETYDLTMFSEIADEEMTPGMKLLQHVNATEMLMSNSMLAHPPSGIPEVPSFSDLVQQRFPQFPVIFNPQPTPPTDPFEEPNDEDLPPPLVDQGA